MFSILRKVDLSSYGLVCKIFFHDFSPFKKMEYRIGVNYSSILAAQQYLSKYRFTVFLIFQEVISPQAIH